MTSASQAKDVRSRDGGGLRLFGHGFDGGKCVKGWALCGAVAASSPHCGVEQDDGSCQHRRPPPHLTARRTGSNRLLDFQNPPAHP